MTLGVRLAPRLVVDGSREVTSGSIVVVVEAARASVPRTALSLQNRWVMLAPKEISLAREDVSLAPKEVSLARKDPSLARTI